MAEQKAETSKPQHPTKPMEDDDEFEEFDDEGGCRSVAFGWQPQSPLWALIICVNWAQTGGKRMKTLPK